MWNVSPEATSTLFSDSTEGPGMFPVIPGKMVGSGKHAKNYGTSAFLIGQLSINGPFSSIFQFAFCRFTGGY